jgi:single-stranded-DNA-specific exonuclease
VLTRWDDKITGSARSIRDFDLYDALLQCSDLLDKFGGHRYAAGLTLLPENLEAFIERFNRVVSERLTPEMCKPVIEIDIELPLMKITPAFVKVVEQMAPFGPDNLRPVFAARGLRVAQSLSSYKERHLRFLVQQNNDERIFQAVAFNMAQHYNRLAAGDTFDLAFSVEEDTFNGRTGIQLRVKDIKFEP